MLNADPTITLSDFSMFGHSHHKKRTKSNMLKVKLTIILSDFQFFLVMASSKEK